MPSKASIVMTYALLVFIWATTPLAIVWSVSDLYPLWALLFRFFIALPIILILLLTFRAKLPFDRLSIHSYIAGACSFIVAQIFVYLATPYLSSGIIALMFGLAPIIAGLIGHFAFSIHLHRLQWLGMLIAVSGLSIICLGGSNQNVHPTGIVLMLISVSIYCASIFWIKKVNAPLQPISQATGSILISCIFSLLMLPFIWQHAPDHLPHFKSLSGLLYSSIMASVFAMLCYFKLVKNVQATTMSLTTVLTPMIALFFGAFLNNEKLTVMIFMGALVLVFGLVVYFYRDLKAHDKFNKRISAKKQ
ncbi:DMT family transporter [Acinetobacter shaoyimingii]|uniref:EamA family transporter n=1 Tax=Acinetobacter shaoyimingii TaxID=2715164 RepID=A0A6G8RUP3_9GAMM|nr:EamA family transporter [Acinetobacter shaoyimingii]QIO05433.1 EamA family transporter [Acinetobacter shaoyimingii]